MIGGVLMCDPPRSSQAPLPVKSVQRRAERGERAALCVCASRPSFGGLLKDRKAPDLQLQPSRLKSDPLSLAALCRHSPSRCLTLRSSGPPPAWHLAREAPQAIVPLRGPSTTPVPARSPQTLGRMTDPSSASSPEMVATVQAALGRCVLLYQATEQVLKLFLPHVRASEEEALQARDINWRELLDSKKTLGQLAGVLMEWTSSSSRESLAMWLHTVVTQRNEIVHHYYDQGFASLRTEKDVEEALAYLQVRQVAASQLLGVIKTIATGVLSDDAA